MFASTNVFTASALSPACASPVARFNVKPPTTTAVEARNVVIPAVAEFSEIEHSPDAPTVVQLAALNEPGPLNFVNPITVPSGAFTKPDPAFTFTCPMNVCAEPTSFVAANGLI
jgi:hypothetical protein